MLLGRWLFGLALVVLLGDVARGADDSLAYARVSSVLSFEKHVAPFFKKYCMDCHSGSNADGGIQFETFKSEADAKGKLKTFEKVLVNLREGIMPPPDADQPTALEMAAITNWIDRSLFAIDPNAPRDPGRVTVRRLNRQEYNNTIRDLVGVDFQPADDFPSDDVGYGFDNIGDVLSMPPILMEKYLAAAEKITEAAIQTPETAAVPKVHFEAEAWATGKKGRPDEFHTLASAGDVHGDYDFPTTGEYTIRIRAYGDQAGNEPAKMQLKVAGKDVKLFDVKNNNRSPQVFTQKVKVEKGKRQILAAFTNDYYNPDDPNPRRRDRNLAIDWIEVEGPEGYQSEPTATHKRILFKTATSGDHEQVAAEILRRFARKAFRRPPTPDEVTRLVAIYKLARGEKDSFERGIQVAVQAVLISPHFLFRVENDPKGVAPGATYAITDHELAARLSYFLWSSCPDETLLDLADQGALRKDNHLTEQVQRMLKDPKSRALVENFAGQWLQLRNLKTINIDTRRFPAWDESLRDAMQRETEMFFTHIVREDRSVLEFLDADYTFLNEKLAKHYGISGVSGDEFRKVALKDSPRGGVLTQASILSVTSNPTRTSPVKRGKWVLEQLLGTPPPPPPPNVPELKEDGKITESASLRVRMEQHRANPNCAVCHTKMDALGFSLENFDTIGSWRKKDGKFDIDPSGVLPGGRKFAGPTELKKILLEKAPAFRHCLVEKMLTYATGRGIEPTDRATVDEIVQALAQDQDRFSRLILAIVESDPFQKRRAAHGDKP